MSIARLASLASHSARAAVAVVAAAAAIALVSPSAGASVGVTEIVVRFRDPPPEADPVATPTPLQADTLGRSLHAAIATWTPTFDGGFRFRLAAPMPFPAARAAVNRLRMDPEVLHASIGATDAPVPARTVAAQSRRAEPPLQRLIVRYREPSLAADAAADRPLASASLDAIATIAGQPVAHERAIAWARAQIVRLFRPLPREEVESIASRLALQPEVLWAQPDYVATIQFVPDDPLFIHQWHYLDPDDFDPDFDEVFWGASLTHAWDRTKGWTGVGTAVTDTGALFGHPDLAGRFTGGYDFVDRDPDASDPGDWVSAGQCGPGSPARNSSWHGTHVSGTIGAASNNALGVTGINFNSDVVPVRVLGKCGGLGSDIADGLYWASGGAVGGVPANQHPARVINMSLGGFRACDPLFQSAITAAIANGAVVVVAAGNEDVDAWNFSPASCSGVITVAATTIYGARASYSNYGTAVEVAAPGGSYHGLVLSTLNSGTTSPNPAGYNYVGYEGTSMAAPHVAGVVSLMLSLKPSLTPGQVLSIVTSTARAFPTIAFGGCTSDPAAATANIRYCGAGIVSANAALTHIMNTGGPGGVPLIAATATLASSLNPSGPGQSVTFTATVTGVAPTGAVSFSNNDATISGCGAVAVAGGAAQCTTSSLPAGVHPILASYSGSTTHTPADSNIVQQQVSVVALQVTATTLASNLNPSTPGAGVTFTATVTNQTPPAATGSVSFTADGMPIAGCAAVALVPGAGTQSAADCTTNALAAGQRTIVASYGGNASNQSSVSAGFTQSVTLPTACASFNDVLASSSFCPNLQWLVNRNVTSGCAVGAYCPNNVVIRLAMARFQHNEGVALTPIDLDVVEEDTAPDLSSSTVVCQTSAPGHVVTGYPRRAYLRGTANPYAPTTTSDFSIEHVFSTNGGATWQPIAGSMVFRSLTGGLDPPDDRTVTLYGVLDLDVNAIYIFAHRLTRIGGTGDIGYHCTQSVQIGNRNGSAPPF